jgi:hypothetical protein
VTTLIYAPSRRARHGGSGALAVIVVPSAETAVKSTTKVAIAT